MSVQRTSGVIAHPTSMPSPHGIGDLGQGSRTFLDWMEAGNQRLWQVLPLTPAGPGNSPYASPSAFAGNPLLISLDMLRNEGLLTDEQTAGEDLLDASRVDFGSVIPFKEQALEVAFRTFESRDHKDESIAFDAFCDAESEWLDDYALYMAIKERQGDRSWLDWPLELRQRDQAALDASRNDDDRTIRYHKFLQWQFRAQWTALKQYANERAILIVGDIPIYVADDSADVWANQEQFLLDEGGHPTVVAGVPPDLFTEHGQLWGNPVYDWAVMERDGFSWWARRFAAMLDLVDIVRIDHFRGFAGGWVVPYGDPTARTGRWERGPGKTFFQEIQRRLGEFPLVVEDLGVITPDVVELRKTFDFPGMGVLQWAFDGNPVNEYLPHQLERNQIVYSGTHDNQTTVGWYTSQPVHIQQQVQTYVGNDCSDVAWDFIRMAFSSVCESAIVPIQDVLRLDDRARMNAPGTPSGNWEWRFSEDQLDAGLAGGLAELSTCYGRNLGELPSHGVDPFEYSESGEPQRLFERSDAWPLGD